MAEALDLAHVLTIWPIAESFATHTPVGDLINLGRTSSSLRASLHGQIPQANNKPRRLSIPRYESTLNPEIGKHQTIDWTYLKSIAPFTCSSKTHIRGQKTKPCVYCSRPICDACMVRESMKHRTANTFKNRLRYYCKDCWYEGRSTRSFRYPALSLDLLHTQNSAEAPSYTEKPEQSLAETHEYCTCNLVDNGWLCLECKDEQNTSASAPTKLLHDHDTDAHTTRCYGVDCQNTIDLNQPEKDRHRVCLWCQKPLRRQLGGEDRYAWNRKTIEARARNAESRSRDIEEYHRNRLLVLRMSRREMRGASPVGDGNDMFVRSLDSVNYRVWCTVDNEPGPDAVYKSKHGFWRYKREFLYAVQMRCRDVRFTSIGGVGIEDIANRTKQGSLPYARSNRAMYPNFFGPGMPVFPDPRHPEYSKACLNELKVRILCMHLTEGQNIDAVVELLQHDYDLQFSHYEIERQINKWLEPGERAVAVRPSIRLEPGSQVTRSSSTDEQPAEGEHFGAMCFEDDARLSPEPPGLESEETIDGIVGDDEPPPYMP